MSDYLKTADVWTVLDLIVAEFESDPRSVQCFDARLVTRARELCKAARRAPEPPADADAIVRAMAREVAAKVEESPMELVLRPETVIQLTGLVQLALRHPGVSPTLRATAGRFLTGVREYFADCPTVLDVIRRGDDPGEDLPW
jgi:hypothetical protein